MVQLAVVFYGFLLVVAMLLTAFWGDWATWFPERDGLGYLQDVATGLSIGLSIVLFSQWLMPKLSWGRKVTREFAEVFGDLDTLGVFILALTSGVAEEALFRATLQPWLGLVACSLLFGLLHIKLEKEYIVWTLFAVLFGFLIGAIVELHPGLVIPVVVHVTVNFFNMRWIIRFGQTQT